MARRLSLCHCEGAFFATEGSLLANFRGFFAAAKSVAAQNDLPKGYVALKCSLHHKLPEE
jgi:hypothetical protein